MSFEQPKPGIYIRKRDRVEVHVVGATGGEWNDTVLCRIEGPRRRASHVRMENFWKKYEPKDVSR